MIKKNIVIHSDVLDGLSQIFDASIDTIIIDPPYNINKDFGNSSDNLDINEYISWSKKWMNESIRVLKETGTIYIYGFSEILAHLSVALPLEHRWLIWHYTNKNVPSLNFWQRSHESILVAWKNKNQRIFYRDAVREPYTEGFLNGSAGKKRKSTIGRFSNGDKETIYIAHENGALPRDVINIPALAGGAGRNERWFYCYDCDDVFCPDDKTNHENHHLLQHPTQKPLELSKKLIAACTPPDGNILVPFSGSGTECVAAKILGYDFYAFEYNPDYVKMANKKISKIKKA